MELIKTFSSFLPKKTPHYWIDQHPSKYTLYLDVNKYIPENISIKINNKTLVIRNNDDLLKEFDLPGEIKIYQIVAEINEGFLIVNLPYDAWDSEKVITIPIEIKD